MILVTARLGQQCVDFFQYLASLAAGIGGVARHLAGEKHQVAKGHGTGQAWIGLDTVNGHRVVLLRSKRSSRTGRKTLQVDGGAALADQFTEQSSTGAGQ